MKPGPHLKRVLPRGAARSARRLSTATTSSLANQSPGVLYFDSSSQASGPSTSPGLSQGAGPSSPRLLKHTVNPSSPTTAITPYSPPSTHSSNSTSFIAHPRYTTNSSNAYPGGSLPLIWFVPGSSSGRTEIERLLPWEGASEGKGKDGRGYRLEMGAYGIPKRRRGQNDHHEESEGSGSHLPSSAAAPTGLSSSRSGSLSKDDPAAYNLAVQVGEDAYFLRPDALGVADGVGGWKHRGESNSALFAKKLMHFCSAELDQQSSSVQPTPVSSPYTPSIPIASKLHSATASTPPPSDPDPIKILQTSYDRCVKDARESGMLGSSTATLAVLADSELRIAHVGDCVVCVVRDGEMIFRSEEMQHSFNYPYQLGPKSATTPAANAQRIHVPVKANDIVILASDGMGDNLWDEDVLDEINRFVKSSTSTPASSTSGPLSFAASTSTPSSSPSSSAPLRHPHATGGAVTNTVLAQRLSEALASRAKRVSERRAISADASGTMGAFAQRRAAPPPPASRPTPIPTPTQIPTPPPTPLVKPTGTLPIIEGMQLPVRTRERTIIQSDGQLDEDELLGDGHGGDGEYGGAGYGVKGMEEEEEEWVRDEIPFSRRAREAGVRFVGGKGDDISVLVAIISGTPVEASTSPPPPMTTDAISKLRASLI